MDPVFFDSAAAFRRWLETASPATRELTVGFWRRAAGEPGLTYSEALDAALCFGWIDGVRRKLDAQRYAIRFTPRRPRSHWSAVNVRRLQQLLAAGLVAPAGRAAFDARSPARTARAAYEQATVALPADCAQRFQARRRAWAYFEQQPAWYRRTTTWWVVSAKRADTRLRRLDQLIAASAAGSWIAGLAGKQPRG